MRSFPPTGWMLAPPDDATGATVVVARGTATDVAGAIEDVVVVLPTIDTARAVVEGAIVIDCGASVVVVAGAVVDVVVVEVEVGGTPTVTVKFAN